jgi:hypothetical protein
MSRDLKVNKRLVAIIIFVGFFIGFGSGLVENDAYSAGNSENTYYGFPLAWRAVNTSTGDKYAHPVELLIDCLFGIFLVSIIAGTTIVTQKWTNRKTKQTVK